MEGQPDVKPRNQDQMDRNREHAEDEWKSWQRGQVRNTLHLVSAAAQWILLLACLIYLGIGSLQPSTPRSDRVPWTHIRYTGKSIKGAAVNLTAEVGSIQIRNGSIMITCDGLYLLSLKGNIFFHGPKEEDLLNLTLWKTDNKTSRALWEHGPKEEDLLNLTLWKTDNKTSRALWEQTVWVSGDAVNLTIVLYLFAQDNITLGTSSNATIADLSFSIVLLSPFICSL